MQIRTRLQLAGALVVALAASTGQAQPQMITVTAAAEPWVIPELLADVVADPNSNFTIVADTATLAIKNQDHPDASTDLRAVGLFGNGNVAPGTSMQDPVDPTAVFAGGIGMQWGVCLTTGFLNKDEPTRPVGFPPQVGVEGPNNGLPVDPTGQPNHEGEISKAFQINEPIHTFNDEDWEAIHAEFPPLVLARSGDPAVLEFDVMLNQPGFLRVSFVFGSDEYPAWSADFNDTIAILVKGPCTPSGSPGENLATFVKNGVKENFSLTALVPCEQLFLQNQMSPAMLNAYPNSNHKITDPPDYEIYYDHEFAGFSKVLTRETSTALARGRYTMKFVIQDVNDVLVDSALFIPVDGLKLFPLQQGDYNGDGCVDDDDYVVWQSNFGKSPATFYDGDGNGDCVVDASDYVIWRKNLGKSGNTDFRADFNRDGKVDFTDYQILEAHWMMEHCASRFEGDANGDGAVNMADFQILLAEYGQSSCGCECEESTMAGSGSSLASLQAMLPDDPDVNGDGVVDEKDLAVIDAIIAAWKAGNESASESADAASDEPADSGSDELIEPTPVFKSPAELNEPLNAPSLPRGSWGDRSLLPPDDAER